MGSLLETLAQSVWETRSGQIPSVIIPSRTEDRCRTPALDHRPYHGHIGHMLIFKIFRRPEWDAFQAEGQTLGAPVDLADGFIHFSTAEQAVGTASKHFAGADGLILAALEADTLGEALTWEPSRGGARSRALC